MISPGYRCVLYEGGLLDTSLFNETSCGNVFSRGLGAVRVLPHKNDLVGYQPSGAIHVAIPSIRAGKVD